MLQVTQDFLNEMFKFLYSEISDEQTDEPQRKLQDDAKPKGKKNVQRAAGKSTTKTSYDPETVIKMFYEESKIDKAVAYVPL